MKALVAYASAHGSTRGIAERITATMSAAGVDATTAEITESLAGEGADAYVLGSAIHDGNWLPEAAAFLRDNSGALATRPLWLFSVGMLGERRSALPAIVTRLFRWGLKSRGLPPNIAELATRLRPRDHRYFAGALSPEDIGGRGGLLFRLMGGRYGDYREWDVVEAWTASIVADLRAPAAARGVQ